MTLSYKLKFFDYWHLSSGLSAGARHDSSVIKDANELPYASGKTIKGLVREMAELLYDDSFTKRCFGAEGVDGGRCYFKDAELSQIEKDEIISNKLQNHLYDIIASTKIENGIAVDDSLREIEIVVPIVLEGEILDVEQEDYAKLKKALSMIKRMGLNRNRGLGRCQFIVGEKR